RALVRRDLAAGVIHLSGSVSGSVSGSLCGSLWGGRAGAGRAGPMIAALAVRVGQAWALCAAVQLALWAIQQRTRNAGIVDIGWALSFALVAAGFAARATAPLAAWAPIAAVVCAWSLRLGGHLIARGAARSPEDG